MYKDKRWLIRELPIKRRSTEISVTAFSGSAGAVGRYNNISILDAFGADAISTRVDMSVCYSRGAFLSRKLKTVVKTP